MNQSINSAVRALCLAAVSACLAFSPARALTPAPDGGYPSAVTAEGTNALFSLTTGVWDTAVGFQALYNTTTGGSNTGMGVRALFNNIGGSGNAAYGVYALFNLTSGSNNIAIGNFAGNSLTTEVNDIIIGSHGEAGESNSIRIGEEGVITGAYIAGITGTPITGPQVCVDDEGQLGECGISSERFKHDIRPMEKASETIFALRPVTFRYNQDLDPKQALDFGLVAEEVAKVDPGLVRYDKQGKVFGVRYEAVNAMLLNEFLKEHQLVAQLKATIAEQEKTLNAFAASLKEQQAQIQKVSAQVAASKPAPQVVSNR
jgi:hypothetical protein